MKLQIKAPKSASLEQTKLELALLALPSKKRARALWRMADLVKKYSQRNAKRQQSPDGRPWAARKKGRKRGNKDKMMRFIPKALAVKSTEDEGTVYFKKPTKGNKRYHSGTVANMHEKGYRIHREAKKHAKAMKAYEQRKNLDAGKATRAQAKFLVKLGCKRRGKKKGHYIKASAKWIVENMSFLQAGIVIAKLQSKEHKNAWDIALPKRKFLGVTMAEQSKIFKRVMQGINFGWNVKKQDMKG